MITTDTRKLHAFKDRIASAREEDGMVIVHGEQGGTITKDQANAIIARVQSDIEQLERLHDWIQPFPPSLMTNPYAERVYLWQEQWIMPSFVKQWHDSLERPPHPITGDDRLTAMVAGRVGRSVLC